MSADRQRTTDLREAAADALRQASVKRSPGRLDALVARVEACLEGYEHAHAHRSTFRDAHDALRDLLKLVENKDPPVGLIRASIRTLPHEASRVLERRALQLWPVLLGADVSPEAFSSRAAAAGADDLVRVLRALIVEGGVPVEGRSDDRPGKSRVEPIIMGVARGAGDNTLFGGRPAREAEDELVMNLALSWLEVTEQIPVLRRGDTQGFPGLVHRIFDIYGIDGAEQALRRYGEAVRRGQRADRGRKEKT